MDLDWILYILQIRIWIGFHNLVLNFFTFFSSVSGLYVDYCI